MFSPIYLPLMKPLCVLEINLSRTPLSLFAIANDKILYTQDRREIGLQFLRNILGLLPFGIQEIKHRRNDMDISPLV